MNAEMSDVIRITLVRHGESESNVTGRWQGQGDSPLSATGREQAQLLTARLAAGRFDRLLSSDLSRARDTGLAVSSRLGLPLQTDPAWREIDVGRWEGLTRAQVAARFPKEIEALRRDEPVAIGGGESWADLTRRARRALDALLAISRPGEHALVFAHGGVIASLVLDLFGLGRQRPRPLGHVDNTGLTTLRFAPGLPPRLERFNDSLHLGPVGKWGAARLAAGGTVVAAWEHAPPENYDAPRTVRTLAELPEGTEPALRTLGQEHQGQRVGLRASSAELAALTAELLGPNVATRPRGVSHVVVEPEGHCAVASLHCAHDALT